MPRYRLVVEYDGGPFCGWQRQENGPSVQAALEAAIFSFCAERVTVSGAGRTDSGVHALGQVAHFDISRDFPADTVRDALNFYMRSAVGAVVVLTAEVAEEGFHARFSATRREYLYRIVNRRVPLALLRGRAWHIVAPLYAAAMHAAGQVLVGKHDFSSFRAAACQADSPLRTLDALTVTEVMEATGREIHIHVRARSFLHSQVRIIAGTLRNVGDGKWGVADVAAALAARDRAAAGPTAPPDGLYLVGVGY
jgi:tRNA pseudouridine38-40 synthase